MVGGEVGSQRSGFTHTHEHTHTFPFSTLQGAETLFVCMCVCVWLHPQTILFSSKAILFDILSSKTELRTPTVQTVEHWDRKYDQ